MIFSSIESIALLVATFITHKLLTRYPDLLFPFKEVPFLTLVPSKDPKAQTNKKGAKKSSANKNVQHFDKAVLIGKMENMPNINHLLEFKLTQYLLIIMLLMTTFKLAIFGFVFLTGNLSGSPFSGFLMKQNLINYLNGFVILAFMWGLRGLITKYSGFSSSDSKSAFVILIIVFVPLALLVMFEEKVLVGNLAAESLNMNLTIQSLLSQFFGTSKASPEFSFLSVASVKIGVLLGVCAVLWLLTPSILKFSKIYKTLNKAIIDDENEIAKLLGNEKVDQRKLKNIELTLINNKAKIRYFMLGMILDVTLLLLLIKPVIGPFLAPQTPSKTPPTTQKFTYTKDLHFLLFFILALITFLFHLFNARTEIETKYIALFQQLVYFKPASGVYHGLYKARLDILYRDCMKDALIISSKAIFTILLIVLGLSLQIRQICANQVYGGSTGVEIFEANKALFSTPVEQDLGAILRAGAGFCPLRKEDAYYKIEVGFALKFGTDLSQMLLSKKFGRVLGDVILLQNPFYVDCLVLVMFLVIGVKFGVGAFYVFYLMKTEG